MDKIKITDHQLIAITTAFVCGVSTIIISSRVTTIARHDAWISAIGAMLFGLLIIWMNTYLGGLYPGKTYVEVIQLLLGKWIGGFIAACFIMMCFIGAPQFIWYVGDFFTTQYMQETSLYIINILFSSVVVIALLYGIETIARASEIFFYGIVIMFILSMLLVSPNIDINNILPVLERGITPVLRGSLPMLAFTVLPTIILNMVYPVNVKDIRNAKKSIFVGYMIGMSISFISVLMCNLVMGSTITASSRFPVFLLTKEINVGVIFTRLEALIVIVWLFTIFNNTVFYFHAGALGLAQLLKLKDYKSIVLPLGLIMSVFSGFVYKDVIYESKWDTEVWFPYIASFGLILPALLLIIFFIKKYIFKMDVYGK
ncbi:GerAB/ArcD/ProY family transporter [Lutispora saccharofermentans]|uniref:Spore germination protein n=1 Tax=Lutispora saccharofermentans TaxID=3024236 RepID=A0ABT1NGT9_9FIRM|nr:endospore germination permease [Lutispora saccharofermentans]MCQ1530444.1 spore germination protein [Lutispora saccharofermentans]